MRYVIGIGSNIGDKKENIERAIAAIETLPKTRIELLSTILVLGNVSIAAIA